jgi:hypothetical protein
VLRKLVYLLVRAVIALALALTIMFLPPPQGFPAWVGRVQQPLAVLVLVCYLGKLLYDTLFYDHYLP